MDKRPLRERSPVLRFHAAWKRDGFWVALKGALSWLASWVFWRRVMMSCAVLVTLVALFYGVENWRGHRAWQEHKQAVEASGVSLNYEDYIPPPIPDEDNMAMAPVFKPLFDGPLTDPNPDEEDWAEYNLLTRDMALHVNGGVHVHGGVGPMSASWQESRPWNLHDWQINLRGWKNMSPEAVDPEVFAKYEAWGRDPEREYPRTAEAQSPAEDVLLALTKFDPQFDAFREAIQRPDARWPIVYEDRGGALLPHLSMVKGIATIQALRAAALLELDRAGEAAEALALAARLAQSLAGEPFNVSSMVRIASMHILASTVWVGMSGDEWTADDLERFQGWFDPANLEKQSLKGYGVERSMWTEMLTNHFEDMIRLAEEYPEIRNTGVVASRWIQFAIPSGWWRQNAVSLDRHLGSNEELLRAVFSGVAFRDVDRSTSDPEPPSPYTFIVSLLDEWDAGRESQWGWRVTSPVKSIQGVIVVHTACAVERFRLERGRLPETLAALVPEYLDEVPRDYMDGQPLRYRVDGPASFRVWSIGLDFEDDGGEPLSDESNRGDITWRVER